MTIMNRVKWAVSRSHSIILIMVMMMMTRVEVLSAWSLPRSDFASLLPPQPYCLVRSFSKLSPDHCHSFYHLPDPHSTAISIFIMLSSKSNMAYQHQCHHDHNQYQYQYQSRPIFSHLSKTFQRRLIFSFHLHQLWKAKFFFKIFYATLLNLK